MEVDVEILDVTDDEARMLLLSIDPLAALAQTQEQIHHRLLDMSRSSVRSWPPRGEPPPTDAWRRPGRRHGWR
jgi:hypothetical protein